MVMTERKTQPDYYQILDLPYPSSVRDKISQNDIKAAYRRALLRHHPDKRERKCSNINQKPIYTMDQVSLAYKTLTDPSARFEYDRSMKTMDPLVSLNGRDAHPGLETCDLDDLDFDPDRSAWSKSCRCGNPKGFVLDEKDLEESEEYGEIITGCGGCSLWLRVIFATVEDG